MSEYLKAHQLLPGVAEKAQSYWRFFIGPLLTIPLLAFPWRSKDGGIRLLVWSAVIFCAGLAVEVWHNMHYAAPAASLCFVMIMAGFKRLTAWQWRGKPSGLFLARVVPLACVFALLLRAGDDGARSSWNWRSPGNLNRARILKTLEGSQGRHLILVRYGARHDAGDEWVYNEADIDGAKVVWSREMDATSNAQLIRYFAGRQVWLVQPDSDPDALVPFHESFEPFPFVKLGTPGIDVLRSPEHIAEQVLEKVRLDGYSKPYRFTCDQWSFFFTKVTGVAGPDRSESCWPEGRRSNTLPFDTWFSWLEKQR